MAHIMTDDSNLIGEPIISGDEIIFTRPLAPVGRAEWKNISDLDKRYDMSFSAADTKFPSYHRVRATVSVQLASPSEIVNGGGII